MKQVMIVDDELLARLGIKGMLDWEANGFSIAYEAENGRQALDYALSHPLDIIITDIKMPIMDGVSLIQNLRLANVPATIIVTSSYDDFQYVKAALRDGADDYLLKIELDAAQLLSALRRAHPRGLATTPPAPPAGSTVVSSAPPTTGYTCAAAFRVAERNGDLARLENVREAMLDLAKNILHNQFDGQVNDSGGGVFIFYITANAPPPRRELERLCSKLQNMFLMVFNLDVYMGFSAEQPTSTEPNLLRQQALDALEDASFCKTGIAWVGENNLNNTPAFCNLLESELTAIETHIRNLDTINLHATIRKLLQRIDASPIWGRKYISGICYTLIFIVNTFGAKNDFTQTQLWCDQIDPYAQIKGFTVWRQYIDWISLLDQRLCRLLNPENESQRLIIEAKRCIHQNYANYISLNYVAEYLGLSPNYFSKLFKQHTGIGFVEYLTDLRMQKAMELLSQGNYKVYEVAEMVGYENAAYFGQMFKKRTGRSPYQSKNSPSPETPLLFDIADTSQEE